MLAPHKTTAIRSPVAGLVGAGRQRGEVSGVARFRAHRVPAPQQPTGRGDVSVVDEDDRTPVRSATA